MGLLQGLLYLVELVGADQLLLEELFLTTKVYLGLLQVDAGQTHTGLCAAQLAHIWDDLYLGYHLASLHIVASLLVNLGNDTTYLWLYVHLVARLYLTCYDGGFQYIAHLGNKLAILGSFRLRFLVQEDEGSYKNQGDNSRNNQF